MNLKRFSEHLLVHGPRLERWPDSLRPQAQALVEENEQAAARLQREQRLADLLDQVPVPAMAGLEQRVLRQPLPRQPGSRLESLLNWLLPGPLPQYWWRPALAATVPLVFGVVLGNYFSFGIPGANEISNWGDEMYLLSLTEYPDL